MLKNYLKDLLNTTKAGSVREESYYPDLKQLIETYSIENKQKLYVTVLPKKTEAGNPDFRILTGKKRLVGYIEAKSPDTNLDTLLTSDQLKRYTSTFPNVILTNFLEFRLYRNGAQVDSVTIGQSRLFYELKVDQPPQNDEEFFQLFKKFISFSTPQTKTAKQLAIELAKRTRFLRDQVITEELKEEEIKGTQTLEGFNKAFKDHLISSLTLQGFSNLFAQTITYGLFVARSRAEDGFNRKLAYDYIPHTIGILRDVFRFISSADLPQSMEWIVDDIAEVLNASDVKKIIHDFYKEGKGKDPIIHFYETFLAEYDPAERERRGVYYTPEPVVSYIVRSIHKLLKDKFKREDGFATHSVTVLDPAAGTLTFPALAILEAVEEYKNKYGEGGINELIRDHILKNFFAFELMMAPYAVGHLKMGFVLGELGYRLSENERFKLYLTNTLEFQEAEQVEAEYPGLRSLAQESKLAGKVKRETPVLVMLGNPPYSVSSSNIIQEDTALYKLYETYKENVRNEERNIQPLSDDYIKFIAFAHWKIKRTGQGIIGMITNNSYLDGLIHRDMRKQLLDDFDQINILNLHGSVKKKEKTPEGRRDDNVFDIQQGVSIVLLLKKKGLRKKVRYSDLWGLRERKYQFLDKHDVDNTTWKDLDISKFEEQFSKTLWSKKYPRGFHFFTPKMSKNIITYGNFWGIDDIFLKHSSGVKTHRDHFVTDHDRSALKARILSFTSTKDSPSTISRLYNLSDTASFSVKSALAEEKQRGFEDELLNPYAYKPFDPRWIYYSEFLIDRDRREKLKSFSTTNNIGLVVMRKIVTDRWRHAFVTNSLTDLNFFGFQSYVFPLFSSNKLGGQKRLFKSNGKFTKPNFSKEFWRYIQSVGAFSQDSSLPQKLYYYIYAVLYSTVYRNKFQEFLKIDFPRIPFTKNFQLFEKLTSLGKILADLHLLQSDALKHPTAKFPVKNGGEVEKLEYNEKKRRVYINDSQYFEGIDSEVWNYYIGGYQVLDKWLKDRKGKTLSSEDIKHYCKVVTALAKTIEIQKEIDKLYPKVEKSLIDFDKN